MSYARRMHFDAKAIHLRMLARKFKQGFTGAEADFDHAWRGSGKHRSEIDSLRTRIGRNAINGKQLVEPALLRDGCATAANHKTAYGSALCRKTVFVGFFHGHS